MYQKCTQNRKGFKGVITVSAEPDLINRIITLIRKDLDSFGNPGDPASTLIKTIDIINQRISNNLFVERSQKIKLKNKVSILIWQSDADQIKFKFDFLKQQNRMNK